LPICFGYNGSQGIASENIDERKQAVDLGSLLDSMVHTGHPPATEELAKIAAALGKMFEVAPDEVAILTVSQKNKILQVRDS